MPRPQRRCSAKREGNQPAAHSASLRSGDFGETAKGRLLADSFGDVGHDRQLTDRKPGQRFDSSLAARRVAGDSELVHQGVWNKLLELGARSHVLAIVVSLADLLRDATKLGRGFDR